ncbi:MAG: PBP1A family penicillin-binding protein [Alphaproteobacteria bacterium]
MAGLLKILPKILLWLGLSAAALAAVGFVVAAVFYFAITPRKFDLAAIEAENRIPGVTFYDAGDQWLAAPRAQHGEDVKLKDLPKYVPQAFIAIEDRRFYTHWGVDPRGIIRALWTNWRKGKSVQGGSTITQQLARNLFLNNDKTVSRKLKEMLYAVWLERHLTKDEILELYLNRIYFGAGTYGVDAASRLYFDKPAKCDPKAEATKCLSRAEAAMLAGLPKSPSRLSPTASETSLDSAKKRARFVLASMREVGFLTDAQRAEADVAVEDLKPTDRQLNIQYYLDYVYDWMAENVPQVKEDVLVYTTLDAALQKQAEATIKSYFCDPTEDAETAENGNGETEADKPKRHDPKKSQKCNETQATESALRRVSQAALVSLDLDGAVRAMVGGTSYLNSQFNRATSAQRPPGSSFKPFVYTAALENGFTPDSIVDDAPFDPPIMTPQGPWNPENYTNDYLGPVNLCDAITRSINTVAVRLSQSVGPQKVADVAQRMGIRSPLQPDPSIALGTKEVNLLELAGAYAGFPNLGLKTEPYTVRKIVTKSGAVLFEYQPPEERERAIDEQVAGTITSMLNRVVERGTGRAARLPGGRPAAGKTGTSSDWRDAWFMGFTGQLVTGVWVGNDDNSQMDHVTGGSIPARIWQDFMTKAHAGLPVLPLPGLRPVCRGAVSDLKGFYVDLAAELGAIAGTAAAEQPVVPQ